MGMPGWAIAAAAPYAADKLIVDPITSAYGLYKGIRDDQNDQNDKAVGMKMLQQFQTDPNAAIDLSQFSNPTAAAETYDRSMKLKAAGQTREAVPALAQFATDYQDVTGTTNPRFFADTESRAELAKAGLNTPTSNGNPLIAAGVQDFAKAGQQANIMADYFAQSQGGGRVDPELLSSIAADPKLPAQISTTAEAGKRLLDQFQSGVKATRELEDRKNASDYQSVLAGIGGAYQQAQPIYPGQPAPTGPNVNPVNGLDYSTNTGAPTQPRIMPYGEVQGLVRQAASDYGQDPKDTLAMFAKQYEDTYTDASGRPDTANWMGKEQPQTKEMLYSRAQAGDLNAKAIIAKMQADETAQKLAGRQIIVNNPMPTNAKVTMNQLTPEGQSALATAFKERRLDPLRVNSKNQQLLAATALQYPGIDLNDIAAGMGLARNKDVIMKAGIAEMIPGLIQNISAAGKKLNYSNNKWIGMAQQGYDRVSNSEDLTHYMTLRNDGLLTIGGVMRSNGMTDMAQRLEEEAAHPTMSPRAIDGWLKGQMESTDPRITMYRSILAGKGVPQSNYQPASATGASGTWAAYKASRGGK